jgi:hypothetical protein
MTSTGTNRPRTRKKETLNAIGEPIILRREGVSADATADMDAFCAEFALQLHLGAPAPEAALEVDALLNEGDVHDEENQDLADDAGLDPAAAALYAEKNLHLSKTHLAVPAAVISKTEKTLSSNM